MFEIGYSYYQEPDHPIFEDYNYINNYQEPTLLTNFVW